jgi:hypothetical protein
MLKMIFNERVESIQENIFMAATGVYLPYFIFQNIDSFKIQSETPATKVYTPVKQKIPECFDTPSILTGSGSIDPGNEGHLKINYYSC